MLKSILALLLSLSLLLALAACGKEPEVPETDSITEIASQAQGEEADLIPPEEESLVESLVESVAESTVDSVTAELPAPTSSTAESKISLVTESKVSSIAEHKEEETISQNTSVSSKVVSPSTSQAEQGLDIPPPAFQGETAEELLTWVRTNRQKNDDILADKPILAAAKKQTSLLVPVSKRDGLVGYGIFVTDTAEAYVYDFRTYDFPGNYPNELYGVVLRPYEGTAEDWIHAIPLTEKRKNNLKTAIHRGKTYYYVDGYEGTDQTDRIFATAWFLEGDYTIQITAHWINSFKPWNPEWFDYFNFENVTL